MIKRIKFTKTKIIIGVLFLILFAVSYFLVYYYRDLIFGPPVLFREDENIEINLYPNNFQSVFIFTNDDINKLTEPGKVKNVVDILNEYGVKGIFFVIPHYKGRYRLSKNDELTKVLQEITEDGHEIAQHGLTHWVPRKKPKIINLAKEFADLPHGEQKRRIYTGRKILEDAGFQVNGFRAPAFSANQQTLKILDELNFLYGSNASIYPPPFMMANRRFAESIYYPYHPEDLNLIEFISHGDFFRTHFNSKNFMIIKNRFEKTHNRRGIFILLSHIEPLNNPQGLNLLDKSLKYITTKNLWKPNLTELALWWKARELLWAESRIDNSTLKITLEKGSELELNGLTIKIKEGIEAEKYHVIDDEGNLIKEGKISEKVVTINY